MGISIWQIIVILVFWGVLVGYPIARILHRIGFSRFLAIVAFIPLLNLIFLWVLAFIRWPVEERINHATRVDTFE